MSVERIGKGYVKICVSEEELENSIAGMRNTAPPAVARQHINWLICVR